MAEKTSPGAPPNCAAAPYKNSCEKAAEASCRKQGRKGCKKTKTRYLRGNPSKKLYGVGKSRRPCLHFPTSEKKHASRRDSSLLVAEEIFFHSPFYTILGLQCDGMRNIFPVLAKPIETRNRRGWKARPKGRYRWKIVLFLHRVEHPHIIHRKGIPRRSKGLGRGAVLRLAIALHLRAD